MSDSEKSICENIRANLHNIEDTITHCRRHRTSSSLSSISMSNVPSYLSAGQLLSPRGLSATSKAFESAEHSDTAKIYALRGDEVNFGLGINSIDVQDPLVECDDIYEYCYIQEGGDILATGRPFKKKRGRKRKRNEVDVETDFAAIDYYHLNKSTGEGEIENNNDGVAEGGTALDSLTPFPKFGKLMSYPFFLVQYQLTITCR
jgi:hypothetical protein